MYSPHGKGGSGTTPGHLVWSNESGWVYAGDLCVGSTFMTTDHLAATVVDIILDPTPTKTYNFSVANTGTYFANGLWVHNTSLCKNLRIRAGYEADVKNLRNMADDLRRQGKSAEEIARIVSEERRLIGIHWKLQMSPEDLEKVILDNLSQPYNDPWGPTIEYLRGLGKSWEDIIESAAKPGDRWLSLLE